MFSLRYVRQALTAHLQNTISQNVCFTWVYPGEKSSNFRSSALSFCKIFGVFSSCNSKWAAPLMRLHGTRWDAEPRRRKHQLMFVINWVGLEPLRAPHCIRKLCKTLKQSTAIYNYAQAILSYYAIMWKRKDYFHFACIYILPLTFLNSVFSEASFSPKRDQISFFPLAFMKTDEEILVCAAPPVN